MPLNCCAVRTNKCLTHWFRSKPKKGHQKCSLLSNLRTVQASNIISSNCPHCWTTKALCYVILSLKTSSLTHLMQLYSWKTTRKTAEKCWKSADSPGRQLTHQFTSLQNIANTSVHVLQISRCWGFLFVQPHFGEIVSVLGKQKGGGRGGALSCVI